MLRRLSWLIIAGWAAFVLLVVVALWRIPEPSSSPPTVRGLALVPRPRPNAALDLIERRGPDGFIAVVPFIFLMGVLAIVSLWQMTCGLGAPC